MKKRMCKRFIIFALAAVLSLGNILPALAADGSIREVTGIQPPEAGMQGIDISESGVEQATVSEEDFMSMFQLDETDIEVSEEEMNRELHMQGSESEVVSQNSISANEAEITAEGATYATTEDAADYIRKRLVKRKQTASIRIVSTKSALSKNLSNILNEVFAYDINGAPNEGDYLYWHMAGYGLTEDVEKNSDGTYTICLGFLYRSTLEEEKYVTGRINSIINQYNLRSSALNDYQKVRTIYDYVMSAITYDDYHYTYDQSYGPMYTTYGALESGYAVCQAYATLFYRLCEEIGISARVICGNDENGSPTHGWNIVKIGNVYYNVDATWDDSDTPTHVYFLKNMNEFTGHQRNARHTGSSFEKAFPTSAVSYPLPEMNISNRIMNASNITGSLQLTDGSAWQLTTSGKTKIILFINPNEAGSYGAITYFYDLDAVMSGKYDVLVADIYNGYGSATDTTPEEMMTAIRSLTDFPSLFKFSSDYTKALAYRNQYAAMAGKAAGSYSSVAVIDASGRVRYFGVGSEDVLLVDNVISYLSGGAGGTVTGVGVKQTQNNQMAISWSPCGGATDYLIYRKTGAGQYYCVGSTKKTSYTDEVDPNKTYTYRVYAMSGKAEIGKSTEVQAKTVTMLPKKGKVYTVNGYKYKVLKSTSKTKTVSFHGVTSKKQTTIIIPDKVVIHGLTYKVTQISSNALKGHKKVKTLSIGANVTKIGSKAFYKAKKLTNIVVKSKKLKSVGKKALSGISSKAVIRVPSAKLKKYKKLFKGKGQKSSVKIKK